ncbi:MFS transporter [Streptomyces camponoticapitis]|uniref:MFS transporter n=1 Tax=Streptomyces camponoticapitis TaxID=1616125 RepID=A0ABQ2ELJ2_9ACTN|nr:MFS transporter [Streptomyces camponoticapitis]GGK13345.1 MFS transporter [Streptomyces camponoticapitis]
MRTNAGSIARSTGEPDGTPLWNRNFRLFFLARTVARFGDGMVPVALAAGLLDAGHGASSVSFALGAWMVCFAGFVLFGGVLADRFTPRRMMVLADVMRLFGTAALAVLFAGGAPPLWLVYVLSAVNGLGAALFQPGVASMLPVLSPDVQRGNAVLRVTESLATMAGPAAAGALAGFGGPGTIFAVNAATFGISGICLFLVRMETMKPVVGDSMLTELIGGWREFRARSWLWGVIAVWSVYGVTVLGPMVPLEAVVVTERYSSTMFGLMMTVHGAGNVAGGLLALRLRPARPLFAGTIALLAVAGNLLVLAYDVPLALLAAGFFVGGVALAFWLVMWSTTVQTMIPPEALNRLHAYDVAGSLIMLAVGRALAGPVAEAVGMREVLVGGAVVNMLVCGALFAARPIRELTRVERAGGVAAGPRAADEAKPLARS